LQNIDNIFNQQTISSCKQNESNAEQIKKIVNLQQLFS